MEQQLTKRWYSEAAGPSLLQPVSWLYDGVVSIRHALYSSGLLKAHNVGRPVIIVGNLTVGGTGKTPLVSWLARHLMLRGLRVGIVSRGYGSQSGQNPRAVGEDSRWQDVGDEPVLLWRNASCPIIVGSDRVAAARALVSLPEPVDVIISDDGLQHLRLARTCEIVVIDGARGFGNGRRLPAGPLREPVSRLTSADLIVINGPPEHPSLMRSNVFSHGTTLQMTLRPGDAVRVDGDGSTRTLDDFRGRPLHAVAGIGNPTRFFRDLLARGLDIIEHPFADHHPFKAEDLEFDDDLPILMTEKDAVKCRELAKPHWWFVPTYTQFTETQERELLEHVLRRIGALEAGG